MPEPQRTESTSPVEPRDRHPKGRRPPECPGYGCRCTTVCGVAVQEGRIDVLPYDGEALSRRKERRLQLEREVIESMVVLIVGSGYDFDDLTSLVFAAIKESD